ncbi:MAG: hypothetical protein HY420_04330 [Candidatus Kerfeldbacteria bacterium]|nr:hypothetical protein [Candidatus Kerfeldbacteria bacterium]
MPEESVIRFSQPAQRILASFQRTTEPETRDVTPIHVSDTVSRLAFVYEKIRNVIDYKEEHLLKKNAIHRILKRRLLGGNTGAQAARALIIELIQARYLPNDQVPETKTVVVQRIIDRYLLLSRFAGEGLGWQDRDEQHRWLIGLAAVEIEQALASNRREQALAEAMYEVMTQDLVLADSQPLPSPERNTQVYLAILRALLKSDEAMIAYALFRLYVPEWDRLDDGGIQSLAHRFADVRNSVELQQHHKLAESLLRTMRRYTAFFWIMRDVAEEKPAASITTYANPELFNEAIRRAASRRYADARVRLRRSVIRSFIFIFLTKMLLAFLIEVPFELFIKGLIDRTTLTVNIAFHPLLMFLIAVTTRVPSKKNTEKLIQGIREIAYKDTGRQLIKKIRFPRKRGPVMRATVALLYTATFVLSFGLIINALGRVGFNVVSGALFIFFLTIISFFAVRIRLSAREFVVLDQREGPLGFIVDFFSLPILRVGRWIALKAPKINIVLFIFDFLIEAPFKSFLEILEELTSFLREKKEEIST